MVEIYPINDSDNLYKNIYKTDKKVNLYVSSSQDVQNIPLEEIIFKEDRWILKKEELLASPRKINPIPIGEPLAKWNWDYNITTKYLKNIINKRIKSEGVDSVYKNINAYSFSKTPRDIVSEVIAIQLYKV